MDLKEDLDNNTGLGIKALTFAGIPGSSVFYVLEDSGVNLILSSLLTVVIMGLILLTMMVHLLVKRMGEIEDGS